MKIPFVIDNIHVTLAGALNHLLGQRPYQQLDIATAYFSIRGYQQLRQTLPAVGGMRLLLGDSPAEGVDVGLQDERIVALRNQAAHDQTLGRQDARAARAWALGILRYL